MNLKEYPRLSHKKSQSSSEDKKGNDNQPPKINIKSDKKKRTKTKKIKPEKLKKEKKKMACCYGRPVSVELFGDYKLEDINEVIEGSIGSISSDFMLFPL